MNFKYLLFSIVVAAFLTSAIGTDKRPEIGKTAPKIEMIDGTNLDSVMNLSGETKIISFWNPKNPSSRITNNELRRKYSSGNNEEVVFISICTDDDESLMKEVMKIDGLDANNNFSFSEISPRVFKDYDVLEAPKAYIIGSDGTVKDVI